MIQDAVRRFVDSAVQAHAYHWDGAAEAPRSVFDALAELGLMGMRVPQTAGGSGLDPIAALLAIETLASGDGGLAWTVAMHNLLALTALEADGRADNLTSLAAGEHLAAWFDGPVEATPDGSATRITGIVPLVPGAGQAGMFVGCAHSTSGPLIVAVARDADGIRVSKTEGVLGLRSGGWSSVRFESTPARPLAVDRARLTAWFRLSQAAVAIGVARCALGAATRYAQDRQQFKRPIAQFQAVQWMLAETATEMDAAQLLAWFAVSSDGAVDAAASARASLYALPAATRAGMRAVQVFGGNGYVREYPAERCLRDAKTLEILRPIDEDQDAIVEAYLSR